MRRLLAGIMAIGWMSGTPVSAIDEDTMWTLTLDEAVEMALDRNPALRIARERLREQEGRSAVVRSARLPRVDLVSTYFTEDDNRIEAFGPGAEPDDYFWTAGVQASQPLYSGGRLTPRVRSQRDRSLAEEERLATAELDVVTDVHLKFYNALLARETIGVREDSLALLMRQREFAENRFQAGAGARFDVLQAEVRVSNARPPLLRAQNDYRLAIDALLTALGHPAGSMPADAISLDGMWESETQEIDVDEVLQEALQRRPELQEIRLETSAANYQLMETRRQRRPLICLIGDYRFSNNRYGDDPDRLEGWRVGLEASMPLFDGGRIRGDVIEAQARMDQQHWREQELTLAIELAVREAAHNLEVAGQILDASEQVIAQAEEALRLAENRYRAGEITQLDVLSSQFELTQAKLDHLTASRDFRVQQVLLDRAIGRRPQ